MRAGAGDDKAAGAVSQGRGGIRASHADREQVIEVLKAAFVEERLAKDEFDRRVGQAFGARTYVELAAATASIPAKPAATASIPAKPAAEAAGPATPAVPATPAGAARAQGERRVVRPSVAIAAATATVVCVWMFGLLLPWPRDAEGDPPHAVALLIYLTTVVYLISMAMALWIGAAVKVEAWVKRRSARRGPGSGLAGGG